MAFTLDMLIAYRLSLFALRRRRRDSNSGDYWFAMSSGFERITGYPEVTGIA